MGGCIRIQSDGSLPRGKACVVLDILTDVQSQAEACCKHGLGPNLVALWKTAFLERAHLVFDGDAAHSDEQARIAELEQVLPTHDPGERDPPCGAEILS